MQQSSKEYLKTKLVNFGRYLNFKLACWLGHCPTTKEIQDNEIKNLASRLKGQSHKDTLTNILDWQERNIEFWTERHPVRTILEVFVSRSLIVGSLAFVGFIAFAVLVLHSLNLLLILSTWYIAIWLTITVTGAVVILAVIMQIIHSNRKIPVLRNLKNVFSNSLPIDFLLEHKLGVCRDYAKLTVCLLKNIYPEEEIYFAHAPNHVATGIVIEKRLYMLDQRLPILTLDNWKEYRNLKGKLGKLGRNSIESVDPKRYLSENTDKSKIDIQHLTNTITKLLNVNEQTNELGNVVIKIKWRKGTILYQDNEMVNYSLSRWLQEKISSELINITQITKIVAVRDNENIIFVIHFGLSF